ncbi:MAG: sugar ABC transporter permease [Chloroflexi bacterium]|nr:sugar ABC transporter permease [Chloroflexota bacterium]
MSEATRPAQSVAVGDSLGRRWTHLIQSRGFFAVMLLLPATLVLLAVQVYPITNTLLLSLNSYNLLRPDRGIVFNFPDNFVWLAQNELFWLALSNTLILMVGVVTLEMVAGLTIALLLNEPFRGYPLVRAIFILPWAIPTVVVAWLAKAMAHPTYGIINQLPNAILLPLGLISEPLSINLFGDPNLALWGVLAVLAWKGMPFVILVLLAGLQAIPTEIEEAAQIDGASGWQQLWYITLPSLRMVIVIASILRAISIFNGFDLPFLLTGGGPLNRTLIMPIFFYDEAFGVFQMGRAASITVVMMVFLMAMVFVLLRVQPKEER